MTKNYLAEFGQRLHKAQQASGITQAELGNLVGLSRASIANIMGGRQNPTPETIVSLARHLDVDPGWLLAGGPLGKLRPTSSTSMQIAALRNAVEHLAAQIGGAPPYRAPDRAWIEPLSNIRYGEWDIQVDQDSRLLAVRAGVDMDIPGVFLVDRRGDMHAMTTAHTYRLIEALTASLTYLQRNP